MCGGHELIMEECPENNLLHSVGNERTSNERCRLMIGLFFKGFQFVTCVDLHQPFPESSRPWTQEKFAERSLQRVAPFFSEWNRLYAVLMYILKLVKLESIERGVCNGHGVTFGVVFPAEL